MSLDDALVSKVLRSAGNSQAESAVAIDLRARSLSEVGRLRKCPELRIALLSNNLLASLDEGLFECRRLRKLDLSFNGLTTLPPREVWAQLTELQVLYLHSNQLASLKAAGNLGALPSLLRLTLHDNPLASHPNYRHFIVNSLFSLRALDQFVISDEELIEGAEFSERLSTKSDFSRLALEEHCPAAPGESRMVLNAKIYLTELQHELTSLNHTHARLSPVLALQVPCRPRATPQPPLLSSPPCQPRPRRRRRRPPPPPPPPYRVARSLSLSLSLSRARAGGDARRLHPRPRG